MTATDIKALVQRLRHRWSALTWEAADALEALQTEMKADRIICHNEYAERFAEAKARTEKAEAEVERLRDALMEIDQWGKAYPRKVFPEPDLAKARVLLERGGMTLDAISASSMRHVVKGVAKITRTALAGDKP
jgi:hypothetical protein